jgi:hypothetical protein
MLGIQRKAISVLIVAVLFVSIPSVLGNSTLSNIPEVEINTDINVKSNIQAENQEIIQIFELPTAAEDINNPPTINQPENIEYSFGETGNVITWIIIDDSVDEYNTQYIVVKVDNGIILMGIWLSGYEIAVNVDGLSVGTHTFEITADDGLGGIASDSVNVNVLNGAPLINQPEDIKYYYGETGNVITWIITDNSVKNPTYIIMENGEQTDPSNSWISGQEILKNIDGLEIGFYTFKIIANDGLGDNVSDSVEVEVLNVAPTITNPEDIEYSFGETGNVITWVITDESVGKESSTQYIIIKVDGDIVQIGSWISGYDIAINVDGLAVGTHTFEITADDGLGGTASDSVNVIVNSLSGIYEYIDLKFEELEAYIDENLCFFVKWIVGFTVKAADYCIDKAYVYYESGHICKGTMYSYLSQALLHFTDIELKIFSYFNLISDEDKEYINTATEELRECITILRDIYI